MRTGAIQSWLFDHGCVRAYVLPHKEMHHNLFAPGVSFASQRQLFFIAQCDANPDKLFPAKEFSSDLIW